MAALAHCKALVAQGEKAEVISAADIAEATSSAVAAIASAHVCEEFCFVIGWVCEAHDANRAACGPDVVAAVLAMMDAHPQSEEVQSTGCYAVWTLAKNAECAGRMRAEGKAAVLVKQAKAAHSRDATIQDNAQKALELLEPPVPKVRHVARYICKSMRCAACIRCACMMHDELWLCRWRRCRLYRQY